MHTLNPEDPNLVSTDPLVAELAEALRFHGLTGTITADETDLPLSNNGMIANIPDEFLDELLGRDPNSFESVSPMMADLCISLIWQLLGIQNHD
jgi:hypothetical protein